MKFYAPNGYERPIRLCEETRQFAFDSLNRKYGLDTLKVHAVNIDDIEDRDALTQYDISIRRIAEQAPIRICENEKLSGAATLGRAIVHNVPANRNNEPVFSSISHLTVDFKYVLENGINGIQKRAEAAFEKYKGTEKEPFAKSCLNCLESFEIWHRRYLATLKDMPQYRSNYENLLKVPFEPAENFYEAVQSLWFTFAFIRLCGNWPGIGRIDQMLGGYLKKDLAEGKLTLDEAREILAHFFIKGCEWINGVFIGSGDAQHYQNLILSGIDEDGNEVTNEVTYLVLDIIEELGISDFPTSVRLNSNTDEKLIRRIAEVMRFGGGVLAVYNEDLVIKSLTDYGYDLKEARSFANDGCWEVQVPGATCFSYMPFDSLALLQKITLHNYNSKLDFPDFESLYSKYRSDLNHFVKSVLCKPCIEDFLPSSAPGEELKWKAQVPCTVIALFERGCIERGLSYLEGGAVYNIRSPHIGGLADTVDSLYAIKKAVYDDKIVSLDKFIEILKNNWENEEPLRQLMKNRYEYYGNDNDEVDKIASRLLNDFADICDSLDNICRYRFPAGVSTFGRQLEWAPQRLASPHGRKKGEVLAANCSPTPGTDLKGVTGIIRSYCKADMKRLVTGAALDIRLLPSDVKGEDGLNALCALMRGFVALGGHFMQPDVADAAVLKEAQELPEDYQTLSVRVSGWNARFVTLNKEWQDMIIEQNEH